jgi:hypothetical protein
MGENLTRYGLGEYKMKAGKNKDDKLASFTALKDFTKFVNQTTMKTSIEKWEQHLDVTGFIRRYECIRCA